MSSQIKAYIYKGYRGSALGCAQVIGIPLIIGAALLSLGVIAVGILTRSSVAAILFWSCWFLLVGAIGGFGFLNAFPTVWITDSHLVISAFIHSRISIPWEEVLEVRQGSVPFGGDLILARRISPFHILYGWLYARSLKPGFVISPEIEEYLSLAQEIKQRASQAQDTAERA